MGILKQGIHCDFDRLHELVNNHIQGRQMLGLGATGFDSGRFGLQTVIDNVALLSADLLEQVNRVLVAAGHEVAGRQPGESLAGRCESSAEETDVHYPTDVSLLWDATGPGTGPCCVPSRPVPPPAVDTQVRLKPLACTNRCLAASG